MLYFQLKVWWKSVKANYFAQSYRKGVAHKFNLKHVTHEGTQQNKHVTRKTYSNVMWPDFVIRIGIYNMSWHCNGGAAYFFSLIDIGQLHSYCCKTQDLLRPFNDLPSFWTALSASRHWSWAWHVRLSELKVKGKMSLNQSFGWIYRNRSYPVQRWPLWLISRSKNTFRANPSYAAFSGA